MGFVMLGAEASEVIAVVQLAMLSDAAVYAQKESTQRWSDQTSIHIKGVSFMSVRYFRSEPFDEKSIAFS